jgi:hypothetical protein
MLGLHQEESLPYSVIAGKTLIGWSDLERPDPGMGVLSGAFRPAPGYQAVRRIFRLFADASPATSSEPTDTEKLQRYYRERDALGLRLLDSSGRLIPTNTVHVYDFSDEGGPDALELEVTVADPSFWGSYNPSTAA